MLDHLLNDLVLRNYRLIHSIQSIVQSLGGALKRGYIARQVCYVNKNMVALWRYFAEPKGRCTAGKPKQALEVARRGLPRTA